MEVLWVKVYLKPSQNVQNWDQLCYRRHRAGNPADPTGRTPLDSTVTYPFLIYPDYVKENTDRRWETWRKIPYIQHMAMAQSKTCLITDTMTFVHFSFVPQLPLTTQDRGSREVRLSIFLPFRASPAECFPITKLLWTFCAYFIANIKRITKLTGQINKIIFLVVYYKRNVQEFLLNQTTILSINENTCIKRTLIILPSSI